MVRIILIIALSFCCFTDAVAASITDGATNCDDDEEEEEKDDDL